MLTEVTLLSAFRISLPSVREIARNDGVPFMVVVPLETVNVEKLLLPLTAAVPAEKSATAKALLPLTVMSVPLKKTVPALAVKLPSLVRLPDKVMP